MTYDVVFYTPWIGPLFVADPAVTPTGGAETQIFLLARGLAASGLRVAVVAFSLEGASLPAQVDGVDVIVRPPYRSKRRFVGKIAEAIGIWSALSGIRARSVVARAAGPHVGVVAVCARLMRRRFIYSSANVSDFDFAILAPKRRDRVLFGLGVRLADAVVVQTDEQLRMCRERFGRSAHVVRSIAEPAPEAAAQGEAFLWIGRMVWYKRPTEFLELARRVPEAQFWLLGVPVPFAPGGDELVHAVHAEAAALPNVEVLEPRPRPDVVELIGRAVAIVNTADFEGLPNILLEGWSRGVPALVLTHDPDCIVAQHRLGAFAEGSHAKLAEAAGELWETRGRDPDMVRRCREYVRRVHSPDAVAASWHGLLEGVSVNPARGVMDVV